MLPWLNGHYKKGNKGVIFQQDNAPAHKSKSTKLWLNKNGINVMKWPPFSPDLNPIENIWSIIKFKLYKDNKKYTTLDELWERIVKEANSITKDEIKFLVSSVDKRLLLVLQKKGGHTDY